MGKRFCKLVFPMKQTYNWNRDIFVLFVPPKIENYHEEKVLYPD